MDKTKKQKINLGIFVVVAMVLLIVALYFIGNRQHLYEKNVMLKAQFYNVNGLQVGNNIRFAGIDVGTVSKIKMTSDSTIIIDMRIQKETTNHLRRNAVITIGSDGLVGNMIVNITPRKGTAPLVQSGDTLQTYSKIATDDMLSTLSVTNENAALLTADLLKITTQILEGEGALSMLINDEKIAQDLKMTIYQTRQASVNASALLSDLSAFSKSINKKGTLAHIILKDTLSGSALSHILNDIEASSRKLASTTESLEASISGWKKSNGTFNYLVKDTLLPKSIAQTMRNIQESTEKLNENMEALQHNFLFRGYFKKQARQARKDKE